MCKYKNEGENKLKYKRLQKATVKFSNPPLIAKSAAVAGVKEGHGPLKNCYDTVVADDLCGEKTWEKAESKFQKLALTTLMQKAKMSESQLDYIFAGDLLNQCSGTHYAQKESQIPFFGLYGACSTMAESLTLAAMAVDGGFAKSCVAMTSSHFCSSEKQYRFPLEYGGQRTPTAQWTVTGSGAALVEENNSGNCITYATTGKIVDLGINDANNMGAAMAPAAADTIVTHFEETGLTPDYYDLILTGDLAGVGSEITKALVKKNGYDISKQHEDCGNLVFYKKEQDVHSGGSGCGCSAIVLCSYILSRMRMGELKRILFIGTGALMSPLNLLQGDSIPSIAHAVSIERM